MYFWISNKKYDRVCGKKSWGHVTLWVTQINYEKSKKKNRYPSFPLVPVIEEHGCNNIPKIHCKTSSVDVSHRVTRQQYNVIAQYLVGNIRNSVQSMRRYDPSWCWKSLAQEVRQKNDISKHKSKVRPLQPLLCLRHGRWVAVRPVIGHTPKTNITFLSQIRRWMFFHTTIFSKKGIFFEKTVKNCLGGTFDHVLGKGRRLAPKIYITFFYHKLDAEYFFIR